jgi:hypothetical protein
MTGYTIPWDHKYTSVLVDFSFQTGRLNEVYVGQFLGNHA